MSTERSKMEINGTEIDFSKQRGYFFNIDCMKALKQMPDKCIDLCICDPPYGDGIVESSQICQVERERERRRSRGTGSEDGSTGTRRRTHYTFGIRKCRKSYKNRRDLGGEIRKKSFRGTQPRKKNTFKNFFVSHGIK